MKLETRKAEVFRKMARLAGREEIKKAIKKAGEGDISRWMTEYLMSLDDPSILYFDGTRPVRAN
jgi:hypothetical protein